ncbi:MAG TPA: hypothetical protein VH575_14475, partial [Gemmataceae bacterium]
QRASRNGASNAANRSRAPLGDDARYLAPHPEAVPAYIALDCGGEYIEASEVLDALVGEVRGLGLDLVIVRDFDAIAAVIRGGVVHRF